MNRRSFLQSATGSTALVWCRPLFADAATRTRTEWVVRGSEGFDALSFLSPLSGDPFYLDYYRDQVAAFAPLMPADTMATLKAIVQRAQAAKILFSPFLDLRFSAGPDPTIDDFLASAAEPDARLMRGFRASPYWHDSENDWQQFKAALPALASILSAMKAAGFPEFLSRIEEPKRGRLEGLRAKLTRFDPIAGAEFYTGRTFDRKIEIILLEFCKPHGIKVIGQRFLSAIDWPDDVHIRTAGHEILHPPSIRRGLHSPQR